MEEQKTAMMKRVLLVFFLLSFSLQAQQILPVNEKPYLDSLQKTIKTNKDSVSKADAYFLLSDYWRSRDSLKSKSYLQSGKKLIGKHKLMNGKYLFYEGQYLSTINPAKASQLFQNAIEIFKPIKSKESYNFQSASWYNYAIANKEKGYPFLISTLTEKSLPLAQKSRDYAKVGHYYSQLATLLMYNSQLDKAEMYNKKGIALLEKYAPKSSSLFFAYLSGNTIFLYLRKNHFAHEMLKKAEGMIRGLPESVNHPIYYYTEATYYMSIGENEKASSNIDKGIILASKYRQIPLLQMLYIRKYELLKGQKKYREARDLLSTILSEKEHPLEVNNKKALFAEMSGINELIGNQKDALLWLKKYSSISDSLHKENLKLEISRYESKFNTKEKEKQIAEKQLEITKKNFYLWIFGIVIFVILFFTAFIIFYISNKKMLAEQREINLHQKLREANQAEELKMTKAVLDGEERERERIAKDLHDGLGGLLAVLKINMSNWAAHNIKDQSQGFYKMLEQVDISIFELRTMAMNLMPASLNTFGLETAIHDLCELYVKDDLNIDFLPVNITNEIPQNIQINIYRIVQELLSNAVKHSEATSIILQCSQSGQDFYITIEDNGKGIDKTAKSQGMGMNNIKNRVNYLKGKMEIISEKGEGTLIYMQLNTNIK
ncbi:sensor histidine kinase [Chryseobacterium oranimense]|uniref:sensor histidine kinase n=1 Tax=Chryseobacterium oranimense TaxID=421058 RepID=UPI002235F925|nr:sensor histidine kinase [Chryseobacterium oranimense]